MLIAQPTVPFYRKKPGGIGGGISVVAFHATEEATGSNPKKISHFGFVSNPPGGHFEAQSIWLTRFAD
jgi:hypothetical protein